MAESLPDAVAALLLDLELTEEERDSINAFELLDLEYPTHRDGRRCPTWEAHKALLLPHFVKRNPGRRPSRWWLYDAPREPGGTRPDNSDDGKLELPRLRLGGVGTPKHEVLNYAVSYHCGIPAQWLTAEEVEGYSTKYTDGHGNFLAVPRKVPFAGVAIDPADPPRYEAQASYLARLGLFLRGEEKRLPQDAFEPERVEAVA